MGTDDVIFEHAHETPAPGEYRSRTEAPESIVETVSPIVLSAGWDFVIEPDGSWRYPNGEVVPVDANGMVTIDLPRGLLG
mgnify:CR=1 FL=1